MDNKPDFFYARCYSNISIKNKAQQQQSIFIPSPYRFTDHFLRKTRFFSLLIRMYLLFVVILFSIRTDGIAVPTILETDIGWAYDDQLALIYALSRRDLFDLKLIICSTGNTTARAQIVAKILKIFRRFDVPIAIGRDMNDTNQVIYGYRWAEDYSLKNFQNDKGIILLDSEQALLNEMKKASSNNIYHFIQISPAITLARVLEKNPSLSMYIRLFAMAGSLSKGYDNINAPAKEYNVEYNIQSAQIMFASNWMYFGLTPLDCTNYMQLSGLIWQNFLRHRSTSHIVEMTMKSFTMWYEDGGKNISSTLPYTLQSGTPEMHDVLAVYLSGKYPSVSPTVSDLLSLFVTNDGYTRINQTITKKINTCLKYESIDSYVSTNQIGSDVLTSIAQVDSGTEKQKKSFLYMYFIVLFLLQEIN